MKAEVYKNVLATSVQENATWLIRKLFRFQQDNDPKHPASSVKEFIRAKKWKVLAKVNVQNLFEHLAEEETNSRNSPKQHIWLGCI